MGMESGRRWTRNDYDALLRWTFGVGELEIVAGTGEERTTLIVRVVSLILTTGITSHPCLATGTRTIRVVRSFIAALRPLSPALYESARRVRPGPWPQIVRRPLC